MFTVRETREKYSETPSGPQPVAPASSQRRMSPSVGLKAMAELCELQPPSIMPRLCRMSELPRSCGSISNSKP